MSELKTKQTNASVDKFLNSVEDEKKREDMFKLKEMFEEVTGEPAKMWGKKVVGFGKYSYKYASGKTGEWMIVGFAPRKSNITIYIMSGFNEYGEILEDLGPHKLGKSCLYIRRLSYINEEALKKLVKKSFNHLKSGKLPDYN